MILTSVPIDELMNTIRSMIREEMKNSPSKESGYSEPVGSKEICTYLGISEPTLIRWRNKGKIPFLRFGNIIRYDRDAVSKALEKRLSKKGGDYEK